MKQIQSVYRYYKDPLKAPPTYSFLNSCSLTWLKIKVGEFGSIQLRVTFILTRIGLRGVTLTAHLSTINPELVSHQGLASQVNIVWAYLWVDMTHTY